MEGGAFSFSLIVGALAVGFFLLSEKAGTGRMASKIQKSYSTQDPVLVRQFKIKYNKLILAIHNNMI